MRYSIGILGCGVMSSAIFQNIDLNSAAVFDISAEKSVSFCNKGATALTSMQELVSSSDIVFLAVKPQNAQEVFDLCNFSDVKAVVSIMAGVSINTIQNKTQNSKIQIARVMPNLPALVGEGMSAVCFYNIDEKTRKQVLSIFQSCGRVIETQEDKFDAVTSVSGSGPAYVYLFLDALIQGGMAGGLAFAEAKTLAVQTLIGAAKYAEKQTDPLSDMVQKVCSKGGTTIEAVQYFKENALPEIIIEGVKRCREKSKLLSEKTR